MLDDAATALVLLLFLSTAVERTVEVLITPLDHVFDTSTKRVIAIALSLAISGALAYGLDLDVVTPLLGEGALNADQGRAVTAIALAGGSAPAHELIRLIEEAKTRAKESR